MNRINSPAKAASLLLAADRFLILTHIRPDGDAAGSGCALCLGLRALGKTAFLAQNPASMHRYNKYLEPYFAPEDYTPGFVIAVDTPGIRQYPPGWEHLISFTDLAIDHHGTNAGYARNTWLEDCAATGELIWLLLKELGIEPTPDMAEALYVAIATDTNGFRTPGTTARTLSIAANLYGRGFDVSALTRRLFETKTPARLRLEGAMFSTMEFPREGVCIMTLPYDTITACGATEDDMDKISLLTMVPEGTQAGILLRQLPDKSWKISLRTHGSLHAGEILAAFGGGGHPDAAGAVCPGEAASLAAAILAALESRRNVP